MLPGLNHNVRYKGKTYHVQTEDSGVSKPHIITVLYEGGEILARKRTSYADIVASDHIEGVVRDLMRKQHKEMMRYLKSGALEKRRGAVEELAAEPDTARVAEGAKGNGSTEGVILDFMTGESGKKRPSGGPSR